MADVIVKVCGLTRPADALVAAGAGADLLGMVFAESSRHVGLAEAKAIVEATDLPTVGVFVNENADAVNAVAAAVGLTYVQLHGDETPKFCAAIERPIIKAIRVRTAEDVKRATDYEVFAVLFDAYDPSGYGGTGKTFAWEWLTQYVGRFLVAGGLAPDNVRDAVAACGPWGVDASSRLESAPGIKDAAKVAQFVALAKGAMNETR
jgi:phosphoribosylanthranilate isomerase